MLCFKAIPSDHPHRRELGRLEEKARSIILEALSKLRRDVFRGIRRENIHEALSRLGSKEVNEALRGEIEKAILAATLDGAKVGQEQIERDIFGVKAAPAVTVDWSLVNQAAIDYARQQSFLLSYANVWSITESTAAALRAAIGGFVDNPSMTITELSDKLAPLFGEDRANMIAVTEVTRAFAHGNLAAWKESGIVERKRWNTANDELVCPICGPLNGTVVDMDDVFDGNYDAPPAHPRCRCWITPVASVPTEADMLTEEI